MLRWQILILLTSLVTINTVSAETANRYVLGPQDRLMIRVYDLRRNTGEAYSWAALNGEFSVGADGSVSLPLLGRIRAAGGTPNDLADTIGRSLKEAADLAETPAASVEIATYRPFFVTGAVQQPGKYEYQPNLTVLQAVSMAQGLVRAADLRLVQREVVTAGGDLRSLAVEHIALEAKQARLQAEIAGSDDVTFGDQLSAQAKENKAAPVLRGEQLLFETRRASLKAQLVALDKLKAAYRQELATLESKGKTLDRQVDLIRRELDLVNDLVARGLTITPRKLAAEQSQTNYESNRLDVQVATLRAQQSLSQAERDGIELQARFRQDALTEAAETKLKLDQNEERAETAERLLSDAEAMMLGSDGTSERLIPQYEIARGTGTGSATWRAQEDDLVEPGDVVRVNISRQRYEIGAGTGRQPTATRRVSEGIPKAEAADTIGKGRAVPAGRDQDRQPRQ